MRNARRIAVLAVGLFMAVSASLARAGEIKGKVATEGLKSAANIAVYIDAIPGKKFESPAAHASVDQRNSVFVPHVTVVLRGTTVDFLNSDHVAHNVYWPSINGDKRLHHSLTIVSPGQKKEFKFDDLGAAQLLCNLHPDMVAYVVIVPTPYFAVTDSDGVFTIKDVPAGAYTLKTWSEEGKATTQPVKVTDATTNVDLTVKK